MDTRIVLSCIPYMKLQISALELSKLADNFLDKQLFRSVFLDKQHNNINYIKDFYSWGRNKANFNFTIIIRTRIFPIKRRGSIYQFH